MFQFRRTTGEDKKKLASKGKFVALAFAKTSRIRTGEHEASKSK